MANIVIVSGPQAVGKMTVAESLKEKIGYQLMVNHDSIEVSDKIFGYATPAQKKLNELIREGVFKIAVEDNIDLIFTVIIDFNIKEEIDFLNNLKARFESTGGELYFVELSANLDERLARNVTPHRLESKFSKNDIERSNHDLIAAMDKHRMNTEENEFVCSNHIKIDNTNLSPDEVSDIIIEKFGFKRVNTK